MRRVTRALAAVIGAASITLTAACAPGGTDGGTAEFTVRGPVELVVPFASGGGVDLAGRTVAQILGAGGMVDADIRVENREGGSGLVGMSYISSQQGRDDRLMVLGAHIVSTPLLQETDITYDGFTALATLYADYVYFFVRPDSPIQSIADLTAALNDDPAALNIGGSVPGGPGHLATAKLARGLGIDPNALKYVPYDGDEALTALLGGHIDVASSGPEGLDLAEAGELRVIAVSAPEPIEEGRSAGIPTFADGGSDESFVNFRIVLGPPGMSEDAVQYWRSALTSMEATDEWAAAMDEYGWSPYFQTEGLDEFLASEYADYEALLVELGVIDG